MTSMKINVFESFLPVRLTQNLQTKNINLYETATQSQAPLHQFHALNFLHNKVELSQNKELSENPIFSIPIPNDLISIMTITITK